MCRIIRIFIRIILLIKLWIAAVDFKDQLQGSNGYWTTDRTLRTQNNNNTKPFMQSEHINLCNNPSTLLISTMRLNQTISYSYLHLDFVSLVFLKCSSMTFHAVEYCWCVLLVFICNYVRHFLKSVKHNVQRITITYTTIALI